MRWSQVVANPYQLRSMTSISNLRIIHEVTVSLKINNFKVHPSVLFIYFSTARFTFRCIQSIQFSSRAKRHYSTLSRQIQESKMVRRSRSHTGNRQRGRSQSREGGRRSRSRDRDRSRRNHGDRVVTYQRRSRSPRRAGTPRRQVRRTRSPSKKRVRNRPKRRSRSEGRRRRRSPSNHQDYIRSRRRRKPEGRRPRSRYRSRSSSIHEEKHTVEERDEGKEPTQPEEAPCHQFPTNLQGDFAKAMGAIACNAGENTKGIISNLSAGGNHSRRNLPKHSH